MSASEAVDLSGKDMALGVGGLYPPGYVSFTSGAVVPSWMEAKEAIIALTLAPSRASASSEGGKGNLSEVAFADEGGLGAFRKRNWIL